MEELWERLDRAMWFLRKLERELEDRVWDLRKKYDRERAIAEVLAVRMTEDSLEQRLERILQAISRCLEDVYRNCRTICGESGGSGGGNIFRVERAAGPSQELIEETNRDLDRCDEMLGAMEADLQQVLADPLLQEEGLAVRNAAGRFRCGTGEMRGALEDFLRVVEELSCLSPGVDAGTPFRGNEEPSKSPAEEPDPGEEPGGPAMDMVRFSAVAAPDGERGGYLMVDVLMYEDAFRILIPEVLEAVAEKAGGDYYIMPSSIHEVMITKGQDVDAGMLGSMQETLREGNRSLLALGAEEVLTDNIYRYSHRDRTLTIA